MALKAKGIAHGLPLTGDGTVTKIPGTPKYGMVFGPEFNNDFAIELYCFGRNRTPAQGGLGKYGHFKRAVEIWFNGPGSNKNFIFHPWAEEMAQAACEEKYLGIAGSANSGKTDFAAVWGIINWMCDPLNTMILATSTSLKDSRKRIWGSICDYWRARPGLPGKIVDSMGFIRLDDPSGQFKPSDKAGIALIAGEKKKEKEAIGKLIGFKNQRVFLLADELPELSEALLEAAYTNLSKNPYFQFIGLGNPASYFDPFGLFTEPADGWPSISAESVEWKTKRGRCLRFDALKSPNVLAGEVIYPFLPTLAQIEEAKRDLGENSAGFWRMMRGFWSPTGTVEGVYSEADIIKHRANEAPEWRGVPTPFAALDPSYTHGGDRCILYFGKYGEDVNGVKVIWFDRFEVLHEDISKKDEPRTYQIVKQFRDKCQTYGVAPKNAALDVSGSGLPFADVVTALWSPEVLRVNFGGKASTRPLSSFDRAPASDKCANRMSELWVAGKAFLRSGQLKGIGKELAKEMTARRQELEKGATDRIRVESKLDMKARVGFSPDIADAAFIGLELVRQRMGLSDVSRAAVADPVPGMVRPATWRDRVRKYMPSTRTLVRAALIGCWHVFNTCY